MIGDVNTYLKKVFINKNITSLSFRQTLIGHKSIVTTLRYVQATEQEIINSLEVVR